MSVDRSAKERAELDAQILGVERQEDEFSEFLHGYERSMEQFRERFLSVSRRREESLHQSIQSGSDVAQRELEEEQELLSQVDRYVRDSAEELEQVSSHARHHFDDERERLFQKKGELPWE